MRMRRSKKEGRAKTLPSSVTNNVVYSAGMETASDSSFGWRGANTSLAAKIAMQTAPIEKIVSPGTRVHTKSSKWMRELSVEHGQLTCKS